jgi:uracil-DNA glycosylase family 4
MQIADRLPSEVIALDWVHQQFRSADPMRSQLTDSEFAFLACRSDISLPEDKVDMAPLHAAGRNLETRETGWHNGIPMVLVMPQVEEADLAFQAPLIDNAGRFMKSELERAGLPLRDIFVTHAIRFRKPQEVRAFRQGHKDSNAALVRADVLGIRPRVAVLVGADAVKAFFGKDARIDNMVGTFFDWHGITTFILPSHYALMSSHAGLSVFQGYLDRLREFLVSGATAPPSIDKSGYRICITSADIVKTCQEVKALKPRFLVLDTEFGNDLAREEYTYTLSVQICWGLGQCAYFGFFGEGGNPFIESKAERDAAVGTMRDLFQTPEIQLAGHHLRVDIQRLHEMDIDVDEKLGTGLDTMLMHHLLFGDDGQGLEVLMRKFCPEFNNYWKELEDWLSANRREYQLQFGYRNIPDGILIPYSIQDVDVTFRCMLRLIDLLQAPGNAHLWNVYNTMTAPTSLHLMDVERKGVLIDEPRRLQIRQKLEPIYDGLLKELRETIQWPEFNPGSKDQVLMLLFSDTMFYGKKPNIVPEGARLLTGVKPAFNTDKYPKAWAEIMEQKSERYNTPSTKSEALDLLYNEYDHKEIKLLRQLSAVGKLLRDYLHPVEKNEFGVAEDGKGVHNNIWADGRCRGHLWQTSETHRYRMNKPNLQTAPKRQEAVVFETYVDRLLGMNPKQYADATRDLAEGEVPPEGWLAPSMRPELESYKSCIIARPGCYLVEADFQTAEVALLAFASGDPTLVAIIDHKRDIHAEIACRAFKLPALQGLEEVLKELTAPGFAEAYKKWLDAFKKKYGTLRDTAKTIVFGILYGRGSRALCREIMKRGVEITEAETEHIIDFFKLGFPMAWGWIAANQDSAITNEFVQDVCGRRRYFTGIKELSPSQQAAARRQASNSPIQGSVAAMLSIAGVNLYRFRYHTEWGRKIGFEIQLPVHDAFLIETPKNFVKETITAVKMFMGPMAKIPGTDRHLGVDITVYERWGKKLKSIPELVAA